MVLLDQIEKLIKEHGSSSILRDHLALFKDQVVLLEKENTILRGTVRDLQAEKEGLLAKIEYLSDENEWLRKGIPQDSESPGGLLDQPKLDVLKLLFVRDKLSAEGVARTLKMELQMAKFYLEELLKRQMVAMIQVSGRPNRWTLAQEGRRHLIQNRVVP